MRFTIYSGTDVLSSSLFPASSEVIRWVSLLYGLFCVILNAKQILEQTVECEYVRKPAHLRAHIIQKPSEMYVRNPPRFCFQRAQKSPIATEAITNCGFPIHSEGQAVSHDKGVWGMTNKHGILVFVRVVAKPSFETKTRLTLSFRL